jgi:hypothetical protein
MLVLMAKREQADDMTERFFIRTTPEARKLLLHLAIDLESGAEKLAGILLGDALEKARRDPEAVRRMLPKRPHAK